MRWRIKEVATELLIRNGYQGFHLQNIAEHLGTAPTNIHDHFSTREALAEEVIVDYSDEAIRHLERIWQSERTLGEKILAMMESHWELFVRYNPEGSRVRPWSLIARMRLEREFITPKARETLAYFSSVLERLVTQGIETGIRHRELRVDAPVGEIALQLLAIVNGAEPIAQDAGSFEPLEQLYRGFARLVSQAYGSRRDEARVA